MPKALSLVCSLATPLCAAVITFDDIANIPVFGNPVNARATFVGLGIENTYAGFHWPSPSATQFWGVATNADSAFGLVGAFSDSQAAWNWGGSLSQDILFDVPQNVSGAYFNVFQPGQPWTADTVQFRAYDSSGTLIGTSDLLVLDKTGLHPGWRWLSLNLNNVSRLNISATQTDPTWTGFGWWAMDDLTVSSAAVPEPATLAFTLGGFLLLAGGSFGRPALLRRKTKNTQPRSANLSLWRISDITASHSNLTAIFELP